MSAPTAEHIDEVRAVIVELEELGPRVHALLGRAARAYSAIDLTQVGCPEPPEGEDAFSERTGRGRLYELVAEIHEASDDYAMMTEELHDARELEAWQGRIACHGNTEPCSYTGAGEHHR
jgi:hypothetical protein